MHEATIANNILGIIARHLSEHPGSVADSVSVRIGEFRNVDDQSLRFAFEALRQDHPGCEDCILSVDKVPALARCIQSGHEYCPQVDRAFRCHCGSAMGALVQGEELDVINCKLRSVRRDESCMR